MPRKNSYPNLRAYLGDLGRVGITQAEFAAKMGISEGYLSDLKNGRQQPSWRLAKRLAKECRVPLDSLFLAAKAS